MVPLKKSKGNEKIQSNYHTWEIYICDDISFGPHILMLEKWVNAWPILALVIMA